MASGVYNISKGGSVNWASGGDNIDMLLVGTGYTFDPDDNYVADVDAEELAGTGYARRNLLNRTLVQDDANDELQHDCNDVIYGGADFGEVQGGIAFINSGSDATSQLVAYSELSAPVTTNTGSFTFQIGAEGFYKGTP